jgi:glycosyltransferase involved in cell wall biosynthesis
MPPRIVLFSKITESHWAGGLQRHLSWVVRWLADAGAEVTVVTTRGGRLPPDSGALETIEVPETRPGGYNAAWWRETRRLVREKPGRWDLVVSEDGGAWGVIDGLHADAGRPPIAMFRHGTTLFNLRQSFPPRRLRAVGSTVLSLRDYVRHPRRLARYVDLMICITEPIAASARREGAGPNTAMEVIPLGVDLERFAPSADPREDRRALGMHPDLPVLAWIGRDVPGKRADVALNVFDRLRRRSISCQIGLAVARPRATTVALAAELEHRYGPRVHLLGDAGEQQVRHLLRAANVLLFPSVLAEGLPIAIMEGLACGTPVLAMPGDSFRGIDVFRMRPDWIVPSDDYDDWTSATLDLVQGSGADVVRRQARALAEQFYDIRNTERRTVEALLELAGRCRQRAH